MTNNPLTVEELKYFIDQKALEHQACDEEDDWLYEQIEMDTLAAIFEYALQAGFQFEEFDLARLLAGEPEDEDSEVDFEDEFPEGLGGTLIRLYERITSPEDPEFIDAPHYLLTLLNYFENAFWPGYQVTDEQEAQVVQDPQIWFFHGLESGPLGTKSLALKAMFPALQTPDFQDLDFEQRLARAEELTTGCENMLIVGSSFGGLLAAVLYSKYPERIANYLLLAPALHRPEAQLITKMPPQAGILHGIHDDIVPIQAVKDFVAKFGLSVTEIEDGHRLSEPESLDFMTQWVSNALSYS